MKKVVSLMIPLFAAVVGITACGSGSKSSMVAETTAAYTEAAAETVSNTSMTYDSASQKSESGSGGELEMDTSGTPLLPEGRKLIRNITMQVETEEFDKMISGINAKLSEAGGYIEQSDISGTSLNYRGEPVPRYGNITARIPNDKLDRFVGAVSDSGNVTNKSESTQDVTLQYSDVESRKKSLEIEQERIWQFLEKAESIDTVITLEQRLSDIRYQLESMESQLRLYDNQVDYSTVSIYMREVKDLTPTAPDSIGTRIQKGFNRSLNNLGEAVTDLIVWLAVNSPILFVLAVIIGAVVLIVRRLSRKLRGGNRSPRRFSPFRGKPMGGKKGAKDQKEQAEKGQREKEPPEREQAEKEQN